MNLIISAHPDDEVLGCGGIIAKENSVVLILTNGSDDRYEKKIIKKHLNNAKKANEILGTKELIIENFPNQKLETIPLIKITQTIEKYIKKFNPTKIFTHSRKDINLDHQIVARATFTATRTLPNTNVKEVYSYYIPSSSEWNFEECFCGDYFVDISDVIDKKLEAMKCYDTELRDYPHPRSLKGVKVVSQFFGIKAGFLNAEVFKLIRKIS